MAVTFDEVSGQYTPASAAEWTELLAGTGLANPTGLFLCDEPSGNLADTIGGIGALTLFSSAAYQRPARGWKRKGVSANGDANCAFYTTAHGDIDTESMLVLVYVDFPTTPGATWDVAKLGQFAGTNQRFCQITSGGAIQAAGNGGQATATGNVDLTATGHGAVGRTGRALLLQVNRATSSFVVHHEVETVSPAWTAPAAGTAGFSIGPDGVGSSDAVYLYVAVWKGANAEMSPAQRATLMRKLQQGPAVTAGQWYKDQLSKKGMPQNTTEWNNLLTSIGQAGAPTNVYTFQEQAASALLISSPQDQVGTKHLTAAGTVRGRTAVPGWATRSARTIRGTAGTMLNNTFPNVNATSTLVIAYARVLYAGASGVERTLLRVGTNFGSDAAIELRQATNPTMRIKSGGNNADGTVVSQKFVRAFAIRIDQTANTVKYFTDRGKETLSPAFAAGMAGTELLFGGDNGNTWFPATTDYVYAARWEGADAEKSDADIAEILEALNWKDDTVSQDATSGWYCPRDAYEWESLLSGTGLPTPTHLYSMQQEIGDYTNEIGYELEGDNDDVLNTIVGGTRGATIAGWTRKGWSVADNNVHYVNGAASFAAQSSFIGFMTGSVTTPAGARTLAYINGLKLNYQTSDLLQVVNGSTVSGLVAASGKNLLSMHYVPAGTTRADGYTAGERIRATQSAVDSSGIYLGGAIQTSAAMGYTYLYGYARTLADNLTTKQIAMLHDCLRYGPVTTRSIASFTDASSGWKLPRGPGDWQKLLVGTGFANPDSIWECQELAGNLSDRGLTTVLEESNAPTFNNGIAGWTRKAVHTNDTTANHGFTSTSSHLPDPSTTSGMMLTVGRLTATPAASRGVLALAELLQLRLTSGDKLQPVNPSNSANGAQNRDGVVRPIWMRQDETANTTKGGDDRETIAATYAASTVNKRIALGGFDAPAPAADFLYAVRWEGAGAELSDANVTTVIDLLKPDAFTTWQRSVAVDGATSLEIIAQRIVAGYGTEGAGMFVLPVERGSSIKFEWGTHIQANRSDGNEYRTSWRPRPRVAYKFSMLLDDASMRDLRSLLLEESGLGSTFLVGLPHEELRLRADATGSVVPVYAASKSLTDWAIAQQRVILRAPDGTTAAGVITGSGADTIDVDIVPGAAGKLGGTIMPAMEVYLDGTQGFERFAVNRERWELNALGLQPGYVGQVATIGTGAALTTIIGTDGSTIPIFDRGIVVQGTNLTSIIPTTERVDLGYLVTQQAITGVAKFGRQILYRSHKRSEWQWLKKFLYTARGMQRRFLLPTGRPDLVAIDENGPTLLRVAPEARYTDRWFGLSLAHHYVAIYYRDGSIDYRRVDSSTYEIVHDEIELSAPMTGLLADIVRVSLMELCRFDSDAIEIPWEAGTFTFNQTARVVMQ